jgi:site-specific recombinase XerD
MSPRPVANAVRLLTERGSVRGYRDTHSLRMVAVTNMVSNGVLVKVVASVLGNEPVKTIWVGYYKLDAESLRPA